MGRKFEQAGEAAVLRRPTAIDEGIPLVDPSGVTIDRVAVVVVKGKLEIGLLES